MPIANAVKQDLDLDSLGLRGLHRLAGAILVQAIEDIRCGSGRRKEDAIRWVNESSEEQFSFAFCCRMLNRKPEDVRRFLLRQSLPSWLFSNAEFANHISEPPDTTDLDTSP